MSINASEKVEGAPSPEGGCKDKRMGQVSSQARFWLPGNGC